jgi:ATP-dependent DNA helicase DinG
MVRPSSDRSLPPDAPLEGLVPTAARPWEGRGELATMAFAVLWTTGPDPQRDRVFRVQALRRVAADGSWESLDRFCDPFAGAATATTGHEAERVHAASARMRREYGVSRGDLEDAPPVETVLAELSAFLESRTVLVVERETFRAWAGAPPNGTVHDLVSLAALLLPGRLAAEGEALPAVLLERRAAKRERALGPEDLRAALAILVGRVLGRDEAALALMAHALVDVTEALSAWAPERAAELRFSLRLVEHPSHWRGRRDDLYAEHAALTDGQLTDALRAYDTLEDALEAARPPWSWDDVQRGEPLSPVGEEPVPLDASDRKKVDQAFRDHLPESASYRPGQHAVAARIAESFGARELLLCHAPTGTGKTLAYLVPTLLWAYRNDVRVGVATFTRALQEQAMEHDVPVALDVLARVGVRGVRVSVLKGRRNYLCWRALLNQLPPADAPADELLAWLALALFGTSDRDGDLDRLSTRTPLPSVEPGEWRRRVQRLLRLVRADTGCCSLATDRRTCAAEAARRRAERSHLVLTNHAFAMSRREFFRQLVFDECEHLHDVAHNAFSHAVTLRGQRGLLERLEETLGRVAQAGVEGSPVRIACEEGLAAARASRAATDALGNALVGFKDWRDRRRSERTGDDAYSLFREFVESDDAEELLGAHDDLRRGLNALGAGLQVLAEHLDTLPGGTGSAASRGRRIRRTLEVQRNELEEHTAAVEAWIPRGEDARPALRAQTFHDLEENVGGDDVLAARVLLPHEHLGRHYYPDLRGAVFLSATTWLGGGFETAATYLGLTRAAEPAEDEEREPSSLATFRAPEAFDYGRVLVAVPRDAPSIREDKRRFLDYTSRFVGYLAERTRGRVLVLFTNADDLLTVGRALEGFLAERHVPLWYQRMEGSSKEELGQLFRTHTDSVLLGLDTFWYGTDFPGETLEHVVVVRLPYGVPDRYHEAQRAALGRSEHRRQIYMPRALAKFRQGFGRLMRRETDRGCVYLLDKRVLDPRNRDFLRELPLQRPFEEGEVEGARLVSGDTDRCLDAALAHVELKADLSRRGLQRSFLGWRLDGSAEPRSRRHVDEILEIAPEDVPY